MCYSRGNFMQPPNLQKCYLCEKEVIFNGATNDFQWGKCKKIMHANCYIYFRNLWDWKENGWLLCFLKALENIPCILWWNKEGWKIPVNVDMNAKSRLMQSMNGTIGVDIKRFYMHNYWYISYAASFCFLEPSQLTIDNRFLSFWLNNSLWKCDVWQGIIETKSIKRRNYFIKSIKTEILQDNSFVDKISIEWLNWIKKYFEDWKQQTQRNPYVFVIREDMVEDEETAERREQYYIPLNPQVVNYYPYQMK